jgi:hypothetical protein
MTARKGKPKQNSPNGTSKTGQEMKACRSEMPDRLPGQDFSVGLPRQDFQDMTSGIEEPEQI